MPNMLSMVPQNGQTALQVACSAGQPEVVWFLAKECDGDLSANVTKFIFLEHEGTEQLEPEVHRCLLLQSSELI